MSIDVKLTLHVFLLFLQKSSLVSVGEEPLMIGGQAKAGKKKLNGYSPEKKTQLNNPEESSTASCQKKKIISRLARKKNSTRIICPAPPPRSLMVRPLSQSKDLC